MDKIQFMDNIQYDLNQFKLYFNEFMIMYDLVGKFNNINIYIDETNSNKIVFKIVFNDNADIDEVKFELNNLSLIEKYSNNYILSYHEINDNTLYIKLTSRRS